MDIVMICRDRPELTAQTIESMQRNAVSWSKHRLMVVFDGTTDEYHNTGIAKAVTSLDVKFSMHSTHEQLGVGGAKNFGAKWLYSRGMEQGKALPTDLLMFTDNDMYYLPGWDSALEILCMKWCKTSGIVQLGGWRHPFHQLGKYHRTMTDGQWGDEPDAHTYKVHEVDAVTGNCFVIRWSDWLKYGPFDANALGPGQSEDFALSQKIKAGGGLVATLDPPIAIHCGLVNSIGEPATGWRECEEQITQQLKWMSKEERDRVLIMRPGVEAALESDLSKAVNSVAKELRLEAPMSWPEQLTRATQEAARAYSGMLRSRVKPLPPEPSVAQLIAEHGLAATAEHLRRVHGFAGLNVGSGQRRFDNSFGWINLDTVSRPPDQVPDIVLDAQFLDAQLKMQSLFDMVVLHHVVEHFGCGEADELVRAAFSAVRPGGSLLVFVPDMRKLAARWLGGELSDQIYFTNVYGAYQGEEGDRHKWGYSRWSLFESLGKLTHSTNSYCDGHTEFVASCDQCNDNTNDFDWREIKGADIAEDWWILGVEIVKP